jgi:hypothetical protein
MADLHINKKKRYTTSEEKIIKQLYPHDLNKLVLLMPDRNRKSIILKAYLMGLSKKNNEIFTDEEDDLLRKYYPSNGGKYIIENILPNRKLFEIHNRAFSLNIAYLTYNENYFEKINSHEKAYWLGFIYTDGYVTEKTSRFGIELSIKDINHLQNFLNCLDSNQKIRTRIRENKFESKNVEYLESCSFLINNKKLHNDLINCGVVPNKTKNLKFPSEEILQKEFLFSFVRGLIDGDGTIGLYNTSKTSELKKPCIALYGACYDFLTFLKTELSNYDINLNLTEKEDGFFRLMSEKQDTVKRLLQLLYNHSSEGTRLKRKYKNAQKISDYFNFKL